MARTKINTITLQNFRNYNEATFTFEDGINIISGPNGIGKTNLLEAIGYLATARSFRFRQDKELIAWGETSFRISGQIEHGHNTLHIEIHYNNAVKTVTVNQIPTRLHDLPGLMPLVSFTPEDLELVKGPPGIRRQYLDKQISQIDKTYLAALVSYRRILAQRNRLLHLIKHGAETEKNLTPWDLQLVENAAIITQKRHAFLTGVNEAAANFYRLLTSGTDRLQIIYKPSAMSRSELETKLRMSIGEDIARETTTAGPHRDDFYFYLNGRNARMHASQGEQRSLVLALKVGEAAYFKALLGLWPIIALDDVLSELDSSRRKLLIQLIHPNCQVFLTTTDFDLNEKIFLPVLRYNKIVL